MSKNFFLTLQIIAVVTVISIGGYLLYTTQDLQLNNTLVVTNINAVGQVANKINSTNLIRLVNTNQTSNTVTTKSVTVATATQAVTNTQTNNNTVTQAAPKTVNVHVVIQSPKFHLDHTLAVIASSTVDSVMKQASAQYHFTYRTKNYAGLGVFVEQLGTVSSNPAVDMYWMYYVNSKLASAGVASVVVRNNDTIMWRYESG